MVTGRKSIFVVFGTRPEAIKLAPVIKELSSRRQLCKLSVCVTAQHRQMLDQMLELFSIEPDFDFNLMKENQSLADVTARVIELMFRLLSEKRPDFVVIQGDTTTVMATSIAAFYLKIPVAHVEAGLRTTDIYNPFPEEINRRIVGVTATYHFAPTERAKSNLLAEGAPAESIFVTGNTIVDALGWIIAAPASAGTESFLREVGVNADADGLKLILVTAHRRESFGEQFRSICRGLLGVVERNKDVAVVYPVHMNPNVRLVVREMLDGHPRIKLTPPLAYEAFVRLMNEAYLILTDSGGVQEEAAVLGKPVLVLREKTERPELIEEGVGKLVGTDEQRIIEEVELLLRDTSVYSAMAHRSSIFGDGNASKRIADVLLR